MKIRCCDGLHDAVTTILLIRHAAHAHIGRTLSGRQPNLPLTPAGRQQAGALADRLVGAGIAAIHVSPVQRARETAEILAARLDLPATPVQALDEIDFGKWTGREFRALDDDPRWRFWNAARATAQAPGGESMAEAQRRIVAHLDATAAASAAATVAMVSHCDLIRAAVAHYIGLSLDHILRFEVGTACVCRLAVEGGYGRLLSLEGTSS